MGDRCDACLRAGCGPGCGCVECKSILAHVSRERLRTLASNLAVAGALCAAFRHGFDEGWAVTSEGFNAEHVGQRWKANQREYYELMAAPGWGEGWRPGCGRNAGGGR